MLSLALLTVSGRPKLWTLVNAEDEFSGLWADSVVQDRQPDYEFRWGRRGSQKSKK